MVASFGLGLRLRLRLSLGLGLGHLLIEAESALLLKGVCGMGSVR